MARNPFWTWSLRLYRRPGVAPACLALQDRAGIDVNLLLFCLWTGRQRRALTAPTMTRTLAAARDWGAAVGPLRAARRALKPLGATRLRAAVLRLELRAERGQQDALYRLAPAPRPGADAVACAADNLALYLRRAGIRLGRADWAALQGLVRRAFG